MATRKLGKGGHMVFGAHTVYVTEHTYKGDNDVQETTTTGSDGSNEYIPGYNDDEFSGSGFIDFDDPEHLFLLRGETGTMTLKMANTAKQHSGSVILQSVSIKNAAKGVVAFDFQAKVTGGVTPT